MYVFREEKSFHLLQTYFMNNRIFRLLILFILLQSTWIPALSAQEIEYTWEPTFYGQLNGQKTLLFSQKMTHSKTAFADIDNDGDLDLYLGKEDGQIAFFENQGSDAQPDFVLITQAVSGIFTNQKGNRTRKYLQVIDIGSYSAPSLADLDNDGDLDLLIGAQDGKLWFFRNQGNNLKPVFEMVTDNFHNIKLGNHLTPLLVDINLDRRQDLIIGNAEGKLWLLVNEGSLRRPVYDSRAQLVAQLSDDHNATPSLIDWDQDGDLDLISGQRTGQLTYFENKGDRYTPAWSKTGTSFYNIDAGGESAPMFIDLDKDGDRDLYLGTSGSRVLFFENTSNKEERSLWSKNENFLNRTSFIRAGKNATITSGDLDKDGDLDLILGERSGNLSYYQNKGTKEKPDWVLINQDLIPLSGIRNAAPELGDLDNDGDLDLLIGRQSGQISYIENQGTPEKPSWFFKEKAFQQIDVGAGSTPRLIDIDQDKDLDLFIGTSKGRIIFYLNQGKPEKPDFAIGSVLFGGIRGEKSLHFSFFDWNQNQFPDLVFSHDPGDVQLAVSPVSKEAPFNAQDTWNINKEAFNFTHALQSGHPYFLDLNGDKLKDLLLANANGDILCYINKGIKTPEEKPLTASDNSIDKEQGSLAVKETTLVQTEEIIPEQEITETPTAGVEEETIEEDLLVPQKVIADPVFMEAMEIKLPIADLKRTTPFLSDIDQDDDLDLITGTDSGTVYLFINQSIGGDWNFDSEPIELINNPEFRKTAPVLFDLDGDQDLDIILGDSKGSIHYFENTGNAQAFNFILRPEVFFDIKTNGNATPAISDTNQDGKADIVIGNLKGRLVQVIRNGADKNKTFGFKIHRRDYLGIDIGIASSPAYGDLNNDGSPELLIGSDSGQVQFFKQNTGDSQWGWSNISKYGEKLKFPPGTFPQIADLDKDGDMDMLVGTDAGKILFYRNDAVVAEEEEILE